MLKGISIGFTILAAWSLAIPFMVWFQNPEMTVMQMYAMLHTDVHLALGLLGCALGFWVVDSRVS